MVIVRCACGTMLKVFWLWPDETEDGIIHVTDRFRDAPKNAEEVRAVSPTDAAIAFDKKHAPEHDIATASSTLRQGRCARRMTAR